MVDNNKQYMVNKVIQYKLNEIKQIIAQTKNARRSLQI